LLLSSERALRIHHERLATNVSPLSRRENRFLAAVQKGIAAAERGEFIEEEEMDARVEAMFRA